MSIYEQVLHSFGSTTGRLLTAEEIKTRLMERFETNPASVLPSDYCYNRWNQGISGQKPLFVRVGAGEYRYLGPDYPYSGLVYWRPSGATKDRVVGERVAGELRLYEDVAPSGDPGRAVLPLSAADGRTAGTGCGGTRPNRPFR